MKKRYIDPNMKAFDLSAIDIISSSGIVGGGNGGEDIPGAVLPEDGFPPET